MNREDSTRIINSFIAELERRNGTTPVAQAAPSIVPLRTPMAPSAEHSIPLGVPRGPEVERQVAPTMFSTGYEVGAPAPPRGLEIGASAPAPEEKGLGAVIKGCRGFEIGSTAPAPAPKQEEAGLGSLIKGCAGFEIGGCPAPAKPVAEKKTEPPPPVAPPAAKVAPVAPPPPPPAPVESAETLAIRKAVEKVSNTSALLGLLKHYMTEAQKPCPNSLILRTTKDQVMKHYPSLAFTQLIPALDGVVG